MPPLFNIIKKEFCARTLRVSAAQPAVDGGDGGLAQVHSKHCQCQPDTWALELVRALLEPTPRPWSPRCCCWRTPSAVLAPCSAAAPPVLQWAAAGRAAPGAGVWCPHPRPRTAPAAGRIICSICTHHYSLYLLGEFCHRGLLIPSKQ